MKRHPEGCRFFWPAFSASVVSRYCHRCSCRSQGRIRSCTRSRSVCSTCKSDVRDPCGGRASRCFLCTGHVCPARWRRRFAGPQGLQWKMPLFYRSAWALLDLQVRLHRSGTRQLFADMARDRCQRRSQAIRVEK
jgi:hypothetical protein